MNNIFIITDKKSQQDNYNEYICYGLQKCCRTINPKTSLIKNILPIEDTTNSLYIICAELDPQKINYHSSNKYVFINDYSQQLYDIIPDNKIRIKEYIFDEKLKKIDENIYYSPEEKCYYTNFGSIYTQEEMLKMLKSNKLEDKKIKNVGIAVIRSDKHSISKSPFNHSKLDKKIISPSTLKTVMDSHNFIYINSERYCDIRIISSLILGLEVYTNTSTQQRVYDDVVITENNKNIRKIDNYVLYEKIINYYNFTHLLNIILEIFEL